MVEATREQFLAWVVGSTSIPGGPSRSCLLDSLADDGTRLPASLRFEVLGCDLVTVAHAARLLRQLDAQGMLDGHDSVPEALRAVPPCIIGDAVRGIDQSLRADGVVGAVPS